MSAEPGPTLLDALAARPRTERALSPDGDTWLTVGDLLDGAARHRAAAADASPAVPVPPDDPVAAVRELLAAQAAGRVPVVGAGTGQAEVLPAAARAGRDAAEPVLVVVTSGSSGRPRAVVRTARSWQASLAGFDTVLGDAAGPGEPAWAPGAPAATLTLFALWHALATGRPAIASGRWHGGRGAACGAAARSVQCVPAVLADVLDARDRGLLPGLRRAVVAGAALGAGLRHRAVAAGVAPATYYGAAELSFVAADPDGTGLRAFPGARPAVRDGVIWVRSPYLALGYLALPGPAGGDGPAGPEGAAPGSGGALRRDGDGWATVGDLGELSPDGVLTVRGRGDGTATVGGATVTLAEVELALADTPGVAEVVALAEPDARFGEHVIAAVRPAGPVTGAVPQALRGALRAAARRELPPAARPVRYVVVEALPRLAGGKVARADLLAQVARPPARTLGP